MFDLRRLTIIMLIGLLAVTTGCTDDPAASNNETSNNRPSNPVEPPDNGQLEHVDPCTPGQSTCVVDMTTNTRREIEVKLLDEEGQPVENVLVEFNLQPGTTEATVTQMQGYTNADGIAKTDVESGLETGTAEIVASVDDETVESVKWLVGVSTKGSASYRVSFDHAGTAQIKMIDVRLFPEDVTCASLEANPNQTAVIGKSGRVRANGELPTVVFPDRPNGDAYTVFAQAMSLDNDEVEVADGCSDGNDPVSNGNPVDVTVQLIDHIPNIVGEYEVTHTFDLTGALPDNVRTVVDLIGRLATDPGSFLVGCPDNSTDEACPAGQPGLAQILVDFLPDGQLKTAIEDFISSGLGNSVVRNAVNSIAQNWLDNSAPPWLNSTVDITADVYRSLREFRVEGTLRINEAPMPEVDEQAGTVIGVLPQDAGEQTWNDFIFYWRRGCENATDPDACAQRRFGSRQLDMSAVEGVFDGAVLGTDKLKINQHTLSLNYGALMIAIVENVVLPEIFGTECGPQNNQPCNSLELALQEMINCERVADWVADNSSSSFRGIALDLCGNMIDQAGAQLRDYAAQNLVASGSEVFLIGTPSGEHCTIAQPEVYQGDWPGKPLPYIQYMGREEPAEMQCQWDVRIQFSQDYTAEVDGQFWGERSDF